MTNSGRTSIFLRQPILLWSPSIFFAVIIALGSCLTCAGENVAHKTVSSFADSGINLGTVVASFSIASISLFGSLSESRLGKRLQAKDFTKEQLLVDDLFSALKAPLYWGTACTIYGFTLKLLGSFSQSPFPASVVDHLIRWGFAVQIGLIAACTITVLLAGTIVTNAVTSLFKNQ